MDRGGATGEENLPGESTPHRTRSSGRMAICFCCGRIQRPALRDMIAEPFAKRLVQKVRGGMVRPDGAAARMIDFQFRAHPRRQLSLGHGGKVDDDPGNLLGIVDRCAGAFGAQNAGIAHLATRFRVEGRPVQHDFVPAVVPVAGASHCPDVRVGES